ncbi:SET domain protein [Aspergillus alliaceus]|uniref:SET domain protein n=1 Tax=Petromyces alliaceus TaxID=209559 RepID=UPI0012A76A35|nr:uncharacterized protein BDW43DRAFT_305160 [Aspergillus alliaceus]KAB8239371.1 hypothetical protein BDW43DRAFT_305160 [Aspergillus alliaceus]
MADTSAINPVVKGPSDDSSLELYTALLDWMVNNGGELHESVEIAKDERRGVHLQVKEGWKDGVPSNTHIIKTPLTATMSYFNVIGHRFNIDDGGTVSFPEHGVHLPRSFTGAVGQEDSSIFFLIGQYLRGKESFWYPYIRALPQPGALTTPLYYEGDDLAWLEGTSLSPAREQKAKLLKEKYHNAHTDLRKSGFEGAEKYTWDLYLWASTVFVSRAFSAKVLSDVIPDTQLPEEDVSVLLPFIDILNHRPLAKVEWRAGKDNVVFLVLEDVAAGQEVSNNYGPRNNEQLMMNYGFCLPDNPCDYRIVSLRAPPGSPLQMAKSQQLQMFPGLAKGTDDHYYVFNVFYPLLAPHTPMEHSIFSPALFNAVSILAANNRELETLEITEQDIRIPDVYGNSRTIIAALSQIIIELITHIVKLKSSAADLQTPGNLKQTHAKIYRDSQIMLSETALIIAAWTLNRAREHEYGRSWEDTKLLLGSHMARVPRGKFPEEVQSRMQVRILERQSLLANNGELFLLDDLIEILPTEMKHPCKVCFLGVTQSAEKSIPMLKGSSETSTFAFPMFLCFIRAAHAAGEPNQGTALLPSRLSKWVRCLLENYPAPPNNVLWALEDEDDEHLLDMLDNTLEAMKTQSGSIFSNLEKFTGEWEKDDWWLSPNWLRWAWMITEQESVQVPEEPLGLLAAGQGQVMLSTASCLYIPQE